jgi:hypothetical protein
LPLSLYRINNKRLYGECPIVIHEYESVAASGAEDIEPKLHDDSSPDTPIRKPSNSKLGNDP